jgi:hypothetical protein
MLTPMTLTDPLVLNRLSRRFRNFAEQDGQDDVLYAAMANLMADDPLLCGLLGEAPATQQLPVLLLAALHDRILDTRAPRHRLHDYYPTAGGQRLPDEGLKAALVAFVEQERDALLHLLRTHSTQTNEVGRCGVLRVALQALVARLRGSAGPQEGAPQPLALFDFGCSAGLNLAVEDYGYDDGWDPQPAAHPLAPVIPGQWRQQPPQALRGLKRWTVVERLGVDLSPVDVADEVATRWLCACVWPHDHARGERLRRALALARLQPARLARSQDGLDLLRRWRATLPPQVQPVLVNTWVLAYFDAAHREAHRRAIGDLVRDTGLAWISAEAGKFAPLMALPPASQNAPAETTTLWTLQWRRNDAVHTEALAWSHAHGKWMDWLPPETAG